MARRTGLSCGGPGRIRTLRGRFTTQKLESIDNFEPLNRMFSGIGHIQAPGNGRSGHRIGSAWMALSYLTRCPGPAPRTSRTSWIEAATAASAQIEIPRSLHSFGAGRNTEFAVDGLEIRLDRVHRDERLSGDLGVGQMTG